MINIADMQTWPKLNSVWKHRNGNAYRVHLYTNTELPGKEEYPPTIVYQNVSNGRFYSRRLDDWSRSMTEI